MQHTLPADLINRVHQTDALSVMRALPNACVDLVFTDPPYSSGGTTSASRSQAPSSKYIGGDVKTIYPEYPARQQGPALLDILVHDLARGSLSRLPQ